MLTMIFYLVIFLGIVSVMNITNKEQRTTGIGILIIILSIYNIAVYMAMGIIPIGGVILEAIVFVLYFKRSGAPLFASIKRTPLKDVAKEED